MRESRPNDMRWAAGRRSGNVIDRRGMSRGVQVGLGGLVTALLLTLLGAPPEVVRDMVGGSQPAEGPGPGGRSAEENRLAEFVSVVLADTEDTWKPIFARQGSAYEEPKLVLFTEAVESACGMAGSAVGPFYCPRDRRVYLDLTFFKELDRRFGAPGDFAQAYVVAHEVGHHVQTLLGLSERVMRQRARVSEAQANALSVRQELQADCFAGVWAHHADRVRRVLEAGDVEEGLRAASAIGDDTLQRRSRGHVVPESFTHGTSAQRVRWFKQGLAGGDVNGCDTFAARAP